MMGKVSLGICGNGACGTRGCTALISSGYYQHIPPFAWTPKKKDECRFCDLCTPCKKPWSCMIIFFMTMYQKKKKFNGKFMNI